MRIALVTPGFSASEQDWCVPALLDLVRCLAVRHEVHVFTLRYPHTRERYQVHGATVHPLGGAQVRGPARLSLLLRAGVAIRRQAERTPFDVLHGLWAHEPGAVAVVVGRRLGVPVVVSLLGGELVSLPEIGYGGELSRANRFLVRAALRWASLVTVGSRLLQNLALERLRGPAPCERLPLGIDTARFRPEGERQPLAGEGVQLLQVASLVAVKDHLTHLRALSRLAREGAPCHLHLVGDGDERPQIARAVRELGLERRVTLHGAVDHGTLPAYYRAADLCVLSSRFESQGMVALEAAACGRSTVGTAVGIVRELVPAELTVAVGDDEALAAVLASLLEEPVRRAELGERSRKRIGEAGFGLDETVAAWCRAYERLGS